MQRKKRKAAAEKKAQKLADKQKKSSNKQNESYSNKQNESYGNKQNESKKELNLSELEPSPSHLEPKYLSIINRLNNTDLHDTTKIVIQRNIDRLTDNKLDIIVDLFELYKTELSTVAFNAVINRVLKSKVTKSFQGLLETSIKKEIATKIPEAEHNAIRKEKLPKWMNEDEDQETVATDKMDESKLEQFKKQVLETAESINIIVDVSNITLENYNVSGTYLDMGFDWKDISTIFSSRK